MSPIARRIILAFALLGLAFSVSSSWVHYRLLTDASYVSPCDINQTFNCSVVYLSRFGSVAGVPVALGGVLWFGLVALVAAFGRPGAPADPAGGYIFALSVIGLAVILYLGYASFVTLRTGCVLCMGTYVSVIGIFVTSALTATVSVGRLPLRLFSDLRSVTARPVALVAAVVYIASAATVVAFFPKEGAPKPQAPPPAASAQQDFATAWAQLPRVDLGIPANGAKVVVVKFSDYECPGCRQSHEWYKPVLEKFEKTAPGAVKYVLKDWPWDASCNFNIATSLPGHQAACSAAAAGRLAREKNKLPEMEEWLFGNQGTTPEAVRNAAKTILGVTDFDREYARVLPDIRRDVADGGVLGINTTPTLFINGARIPTGQGLMPPQYFELAIELELKKGGA